MSEMSSVVVDDMSDIPHFNLFVSDDEIENGAVEILKNIRPSWDLQDVSFKVFTDGITNKLLGCFNSTCTGDVILVRVYGHNTDLIIDRKAETRNFKLLEKAGHAPPLYATFKNGLAYKYVPGIVLTEDLVQSPQVYPIVARTMACFHKLSYDISIPRVPTLWNKCATIISLIPDTYTPTYRHARYLEFVPGAKEMLSQELLQLESDLSKLESPVVFCHNDLLLANIILHSDSDSVTFIDYEYASYNYQAYDIGNHFDEFAGVTTVDYNRYPDRELQWDWLRIYLEEYNCDIENYEVTDSEIEKLYVQVNKFAAAASFMWGVWSLVQANVSQIDFDFLEYANIRLSHYYSKKEELNQLSVPS